MKNSISLMLNYLIWGFILGFIIGINVSLFMNFLSPPITNSLNVVQFIFEHTFNWTLNGLYINGILGMLDLLFRPNKTKINK